MSDEGRRQNEARVDDRGVNIEPGGHFFEDPDGDFRVQEWAHGCVYSAVGMLTVIEGYFDGKRQRIYVDEHEIDELCRRLHAAKRYSRLPVEGDGA